MTHVKRTKDSSNEYDAIFVLKHEALYDGLREYFMSLMPEEQVHASVVSIHSMILNQINVRRYQEEIYIVPLDIVEEINDFKYQYGPNLLLHEMNIIRDKVIWKSEVIRLPKPSAALSSPYCQFTYGDLDSK
ncbi:hypothetical protein AHAS_Ahas08G0063400 [Arachis hypogaea]